MKPRIKREIDAEIQKLKKLCPVGIFATKTAASIQAAITELEHGHDRTAEEWGELSPSEQDAADCAELWKLGQSDQSPSTGWGALVS